MFSIGDHVFYGTTGVCQIVDIKSEQFGNSGAEDYYVLKQLGNNCLAYVSTTNPAHLARLRPVMTRHDIDLLIQSMPGLESVWLSDERRRNEVFVEKLRTGDSHELVKLIRTLYLEKTRKRGSGKRLNSTDAKIMTAAERLLHEEFAFVLGIKTDEVVPFIRERVPA